jgi:hypothetical protein
MNNIFISYRREDTEGFARGLFQSLVGAVGADHVFMDVEAISLITDFVEAIDKSLANCVALLVLIGKDWLDCTDAAGNRRPDDHQDFVRMEVARAFEKGVPVIPVLVKNAKMPTPASLPDMLQPLSRRQALELRHERWSQDVNHLVSSLADLLGLDRMDRPAAQPSPPVKTPRQSGNRMVLGLAAVVVAIVAVVGYVLVTGTPTSRPKVQPEIEKQAAQDPEASPKPVSISPSKEDKVATAPKPKAKPAPKPPQTLNLSGVWVDADGVNVQIAQQGNELMSQSYNPQTGMAISAVWQISGRQVSFDWTSNMGNQGVGEGTIASDGNTIDYRYVDHYTGEQGYSRLFRVAR